MAFKQYQDTNGDQIIEIPWNAAKIGRILLGVAVLGVVVFTVIQILDGKMWEIGELLVNALILAILVYLGTACLRNKTIVRLSSNGTVHISYGPRPLMPGTRLRQDELGYVQAYHYRSPRSDIWTWRVALFSRAGRETPLTLGGLASDEEAKDLEKTVKDFFRLPDKSEGLKDHSGKFGDRS